MWYLFFLYKWSVGLNNLFQHTALFNSEKKLQEIFYRADNKYIYMQLKYICIDISRKEIKIKQ